MDASTHAAVQKGLHETHTAEMKVVWKPYRSCTLLLL